MDGTVEQLAVHTVGGRVEPARPLMVAVPEDGAVEVEATLPNKDIGFVRAGQEAEVKLQTFPYTKYGTIGGVVTDVLQDAVQIDCTAVTAPCSHAKATRARARDSISVSLGDRAASHDVNARVGVGLCTDRARLMICHRAVWASCKAISVPLG